MMEQFKYLETTLNNQKRIQEDFKSRFKSGNSRYHSVQNLMSSSSLFKHVNIKINRTIGVGKLQNGEPNDLNYSLNINREILFKRD
jgi:hypothetical protein